LTDFALTLMIKINIINNWQHKSFFSFANALFVTLTFAFYSTTRYKLERIDSRHMKNTINGKKSRLTYLITFYLFYFFDLIQSYAFGHVNLQLLEFTCPKEKTRRANMKILVSTIYIK